MPASGNGWYCQSAACGRKRKPNQSGFHISDKVCPVVWVSSDRKVYKSILSWRGFGYADDMRIMLGAGLVLLPYWLTGRCLSRDSNPKGSLRLLPSTMNDDYYDHYCCWWPNTVLPPNGRRRWRCWWSFVVMWKSENCIHSPAATEHRKTITGVVSKYVFVNAVGGGILFENRRWARHETPLTLH